MFTLQRPASNLPFAFLIAGAWLSPVVCGCGNASPEELAGSGGTAASGSGGQLSIDSNSSTGGMEAASGSAPGAGGQSNLPGTGGATSTGDGKVEVISDGFQIAAELASDVEASAPTTVGIVTWTHSDPSLLGTARLEFGLDESYGQLAPAENRALLLGLKPETTYHFRIRIETASGVIVSPDQTLQTGAATDLVHLASFDVKNDALREKGYIVSSFWRGDGASVIFILDADGDVVWWFDTGRMGIARARMSADGRNMWMVEPNNMGASIARVTMDTLEGETYSNTVGSHDITPVTGATMAYLDYSESDCDSIFEIDPSGATQEVWDSSDVTQSGSCHGNALRYSKSEDVYTFSDVSTDVWVVGRTGQFMWGLADRVAGGVAAWGGRNHGHHLLDDSIVVFANAGGGTMISSVVEYDLMGNELLSYVGGEFSANLGDVQRLPGGNTFITYSNAGVIQEITPDQEVVLEARTEGQSFGYAVWRDSLYGEPSDVGL